MNPAIFNREIRELKTENQELRQKLRWADYMQSEEIQRHIEKLHEQIESVRADLRAVQKQNELFRAQIELCDSLFRESSRLKEAQLPASQQQVQGM